MEQLQYVTQELLLRCMKTIRLQDSLGQKIQDRHLFTMACLLAANQCDTNVKGPPLFLKSIR